MGFLGIKISIAQNGLERIFVEKYYISNASDSVGSIGNLPSGSVTYRVFADMLPGYKFQAIYGVPAHSLKINTSTGFFNNEDRGATTPNNITTSFLDDNTVALDSWFSVGSAGRNVLGVPKTQDNGLANLISTNTILKNNDLRAGIPLTSQDGIVDGIPVAVTFVGISAAEQEVFKSVSNFGNSFTTSNGSVSALGGSVGASTDSNIVLIGQFTTNGFFHFELNVQIGTPTGGTQNYVTSNPTGSERFISSINYTSEPRTSPITYCKNATASALSALKLSGATLKWYTNATGGTGSTTAPVPSTSSVGSTTYYVTQTDASSGTESPRAPLVVTIIDAPTIATPATPSTICAGSSYNPATPSVTDNGSAITAQGWQIETTLGSNNYSALTIPYLVSFADNGKKVRYAATNSCGTSTSNSITLSINDLPTISSPSIPLAICAGGSYNPNDPSVTANGSSVTAQGWQIETTVGSNNYTTLTVPYIVDVTDNGKKVRYTATNACGTSNSSTVVLLVNNIPAKPTISANGPLTICQGESVILTSSANINNTWSSSENTKSITVNSSGNYTVTFTDANACSATSEITTVVVNTLPTAPVITASSSTNFCEGGTVNIVSNEANNIVWNNNETNDTLTVNSSGNYFVRYTDNNNCSSNSNSINVTVNPKYTITKNYQTCSGSGIVLGGSLQTTSGVYYDTLSTINGCDSIIISNLTVTDTVISNLFVSICPGDSVFAQGAYQTIAGDYSDTIPGAAVGGCDSVIVTHLIVKNLYSINTTKSICAGESLTFGGSTLTQAGTYTNTYVSALGCDSTVNLTLIVNALPSAPVISPSGNNGVIAICDGDSVILSSSYNSGNIWSDLSTDNKLIVNVAGNYTVKYTDANGCTSAQEAINVIVNALPGQPSIITPNGSSACQGSSLLLVTSATAASYSWNNSQINNDSILVNNSGSYILTITDLNGCKAQSLATIINFNSLPATPSISAPNGITGCTGDSILIITTASAVSYNWSDNLANNDSVYVKNSGNYSLIISDNNGCNSLVSNSISITIDICTSINKLENKITVMPNPTNGFVNIKFNNAFNGNLSIYDVTGKLIDSMSLINLDAQQIDLSNLVTGIYLIEVSNTNQIVERIKLVKQ